ncbi:phosphotransferase family protein [Gordonia mangrovi]|uniref:phosphotransferase family protein n=1 Tax=Gordonia mangrovi TaxID=2665643 RepID=UPI0021AC70DB|nr:phosphotransferase family protein [Gordonia mangrovi]UVF76912.1 phosphotransferase family protein [Gordonia mangrovi]
MSETDTVTAALREFIAKRLSPGADPTIDRIYRTGLGSSRENWPFDATWTVDGAKEEHHLLLRRDPPAAVVETGRAMEFELLRRLGEFDVPTPDVLWLDDQGGELTRPSIVVKRYVGQAHRAVLRHADPLELGIAQRELLAREICTTLTDLHNIDTEAAGFRGILHHPGPNPAAYELEHWRSELERCQMEPQPALQAAAEWLRDSLPGPVDRLVVVHGDFRPANLLIHEGRVEVLLDWELAHLGDPLDDLGWYTAPLYQKEHFIKGFWEQEDFLELYTARTNIEVDPHALRFWQVMSTFRLAVMALAGIKNFCTKGSDRPAAPARFVIDRVMEAVIEAQGARDAT